MTNALLIRRRGMMTAQGGGGNWYVTNGLVLHLDGILKGQTANAWTDLVAGYVFDAVGNVEFNVDNVRFGYDGYSWLENTLETFLSCPNTETGTIEIVAEKYGTLYDIFIPSVNNKGICFIERSTGVLWRYGRGEFVRRTITTLTKGSYSISKDYKLENGVPMTVSTETATFVSTVQKPACVGRSNSSYFNGRVYSIRVYNRQLSEAEVLYNLAIDNARFNLGL